MRTSPIPGRPLSVLSLAVAIVTLTLFPLNAHAAKSDKRLTQATQLLTDRKTDEAVKLLHALGNDPKAAREERLMAFSKLLEIYRHKKDAEAGVATTREMIAAFPRDDDFLTQVYFTQAKLLASAHKPDEAVEACHQVVAHSATDKASAIEARFLAASLLHDSRDFTRLFDEATELLHLLGDDPRAADALWQLADATWQTGRYHESLENARRILAEYPEAAVWRSRAVHGHVANCLRKLDKPGEVRAFCEEWEKKDPDSRWRQKWCLSAAETCTAGKDPAAALAAYRRVIAGHCDDNMSDLWYEAQGKIVELLTTAGDFKVALQEAHILFNASRPSTITQDTQRIADLLTKLDKGRDRADRFLAFQHYGPDGPDGKPGTDDDLVNPLGEIGYTADRDRKSAFAAAFNRLGDDAAAMHHRGVMCVYAGEPKAALYYFMDAFRRSHSDRFQDCAISLVVNGLRGVRGHSVGLNDAVRFILYGPKGENGKGDGDMPDPFAPYASLSPPAPLAVRPQSEKDLLVLKQLQAALMISAVDPAWPPAIRVKALSALARLNEVLDAWPSNADWYRDLLRAAADSGLKAAVLDGAISASKGNVLHLGKVREFLASLEDGDLIGSKVSSHHHSAAGKGFRQCIAGLTPLLKPGALMPKVRFPSAGKRKH